MDSNPQSRNGVSPSENPFEVLQSLEDEEEEEPDIHEGKETNLDPKGKEDPEEGEIPHDKQFDPLVVADRNASSGKERNSQ